jgi:hypothetical protein
VGLAPISLRPRSARGTAFQCQYLLHPGWDKQVPSMKLPRRLTVSLSLAIAEAPTVLSLIGCRRLRSVSGILRSQRGRRGSGLGRLLAGTAYAGLAMRSRARPPSTKLQHPLLHPCGLASRLCGSTLRRMACLSPLWLNSGRRRAVPTSHWQWVSSRAACRRAGSPARIAIVVLACVQWGGLGLPLPESDRRQHRVSRGPGDRWSRPSPVRG